MNSMANPMSFDAEFDVLVIGAGGCGLVAALAAHENGMDVAIVEKMDRVQGNTVLSSGSIPAADTRFQRAAGVVDSPDVFVEDLERVAGRHDAPELTRRLADSSAELVEWLVDNADVNMTLVETYKHIGHRVHR